MAESRSRKLAQQLLFGVPGAPVQDDLEEELDDLDFERRGLGSARTSAYVEVLEDVVRIVLETELHLLSDREIEMLRYFSTLTYGPRYCLARLLLRKPGCWHPVSTLEKYKIEIGTELETSLKKLCDSTPASKQEQLPSTKPDLAFGFVKVEEPEIKFIDLTSSDPPQPTASGGQAGPSRLAGLNAENSFRRIAENQDQDFQLDFLCEDETEMTLAEVLGRLNKDQLQLLAKELKCKLASQARKEAIIRTLMTTASNQTLLSNFIKGKGKAVDTHLRQTQLPFGTKRNQADRLKEIAVKRLGSCIRVNFDFFRLIRRIHLICYRETVHPSSILLPGLLARFKKRNYSVYQHHRSNDVWSTRKDLVDYEQALVLEQALEELLDPSNDTSISRTPAPSVTSDRQSHRRSSTIFESKWEEAATQEAPFHFDSKTTRMRSVRTVFQDYIWPRWQEHLGVRTNAVNEAPRNAGFERFEIGYVYTRMAYRALSVFGPLKDYRNELIYLDALLSQRFWRRGKRADWHERKAILRGHIQRQLPQDRKEEELWKTYHFVQDALCDDDTSLIWRPKFVRRLRQLEKQLKVPTSEQVQCARELQPAGAIVVRAVKLDPPVMDPSGRIINKDQAAGVTIKHYLSTKGVEDKPSTKVLKPKHGKSSWRGRGGETVNVETIALQHYEDHGFKGLHAETRILTTLYGLLFWDIIFMEVPGAFETPYQNAPLDLFEETFYYARKEKIDERIKEIEEGQGQEILKRHDDKHRASKTFCLGVNWDLCEKEDLLEIAQGLGGKPLGAICKLFCEDYQGRGSGVPDLIIWKISEQKCKFVEVKGPGDTLQENQKLWVDTLLSVEADVEMCYVRDVSDHSDPTASGSKKRKLPVGKGKKRRKSVVDGDGSDQREEDQDYDQLDPDDDELNATTAKPTKRRKSN